MTTTTAVHPLVGWLLDLHTTRLASHVPAKRLRAHAEQVLLAGHDPTGDTCGRCAEPFPCLQWRAIAAGWAHAPGYDNDWLPRTTAATADAGRS